MARDLAPFNAFIAAHAPGFGLPPGLVQRQMLQESGGNPLAVSHAGAQGLMQLMPGTAAYLNVTDPFDPQQNLLGGMRYMQEQLRDFGGDTASALAAYNWGPGNVRKAQRRYGPNWLAHAPKETRDYVQKLTGSAGPIMNGESAQVTGLLGPAGPVSVVPGAPSQPPGLLGGGSSDIEGLLGLMMLASAFGGGDGGGLGAVLSLLLERQQTAPVAAPKMGITEVSQGDQIVTYLTQDGVPTRPIGSAPRWQPPVPSAPSEPELKVIGDVPYTFQGGQLTQAPGYQPPPPQPTGLDAKETATVANTVTDNYRTDMKVPGEILRRWDLVKDYTPGEMNPQQQRALIVSYAKTLDPSSAVLGGEAEVIEQAGRKFPWVSNLWTKAQGEGLTEIQQQQIMDEVRRMAQQSYASSVDLWTRYGQQFRNAGIDPTPYIGHLQPFPAVGGRTGAPGTSETPSEGWGTARS